MSNQQEKKPKSPYQSNRATPSEPSVPAPINQPVSNEPATIQKARPSSQNIPTKNRSAVTTPRQSQSSKQPTLGTLTNSSSCVPRDRTSLRANTSQRPPPRDKSSPIFNPAVTSTPKSKQSSPSTPFQTGPKTPEPKPPASCPPEERPPRSEPVHPASHQSENGCKVCVCPLSAGNVSIPRNAASLNICVPAELVQRPPSKEHEGVKKEHILKLEILSISGGTLYDLDKIHQQRRLTKTPEPTYDPTFDIDCIEPIKKESAGKSGAATSHEKDRKPMLVNEKDEDRVEQRSSDDEGTFIMCEPSSGSESSTIRDSTLVGTSAAPRKQTGSDDEHDVWRSDPGAPASFRLSDVSSTGTPPDREETEDKTMIAFPRMDLQEVGLEEDSGVSGQQLRDESAELGDVSVPREESFVMDVSELADSKRRGGDGESGVRVDREADVKEGKGGTSEKKGEADLKIEDEERGIKGEADAKGSKGKVDLEAYKGGEVDTEADRGSETDITLGKEGEADRKTGIDMKTKEKEEDKGEAVTKADKGRELPRDTETDMGVDVKTEEKGNEKEGEGVVKADEVREPDGDRGTDRKMGTDVKTEEKEGETVMKVDKERESDRDRGTDEKMGIDVKTEEKGSEEEAVTKADKGRESDRDRGMDRNMGIDMKTQEKGGEEEAIAKADEGREAGKTGREADRGVEADGRTGFDRKTDEQGGTEGEADAKGSEGVGTEPRRDESIRPRDGGKDGGVDRKDTVGQLSDTQTALRPGSTDTKDGEQTSDRAPLVADRTIPAERSENGQANGMSDEGSGSVSLILGPSVRNFAHLALSPLTTLRTFLGPAAGARPSRKKRFRRTDDLSHPEFVRMRSIRSAFVATPYDAAATSCGFFLRRFNRNCAGKTGSAESESSSEDE